MIERQLLRPCQACSGDFAAFRVIGTKRSFVVPSRVASGPRRQGSLINARFTGRWRP